MLASCHTKFINIFLYYVFSRTIHGSLFTNILYIDGLSFHCDTIFQLENGELKGQGSFEKLIEVNEKFRESVAKS